MGDYADVDALRAEIRTELRTREEERVSQETQALAIDKLVELSTIEFPPQLVDREADHLYETFTHNVEQQGIKLEQYLRLTGKDEAALRAEIRTEAETRVRRSLALDAFANAEQISVDESELSGEAGAAGEAAESVALANPRTRERLEGVMRERKAMARLVELATAAAARPRRRPSRRHRRPAPRRNPTPRPRPRRSPKPRKSAARLRLGPILSHSPRRRPPHPKRRWPTPRSSHEPTLALPPPTSTRHRRGLRRRSVTRCRWSSSRPAAASVPTTSSRCC